MALKGCQRACHSTLRGGQGKAWPCMLEGWQASTGVQQPAAGNCTPCSHLWSCSRLHWMHNPSWLPCPLPVPCGRPTCSEYIWPILSQPLCCNSLGQALAAGLQGCKAGGRLVLRMPQQALRHSGLMVRRDMDGRVLAAGAAEVQAGRQRQRAQGATAPSRRLRCCNQPCWLIARQRAVACMAVAPWCCCHRWVWLSKAGGSSAKVRQQQRPQVKARITETLNCCQSLQQSSREPGRAGARRCKPAQQFLGPLLGPSEAPIGLFPTHPNRSPWLRCGGRRLGAAGASQRCGGSAARGSSDRQRLETLLTVFWRTAQPPCSALSPPAHLFSAAADSDSPRHSGGPPWLGALLMWGPLGEQRAHGVASMLGGWSSLPTCPCH